MCCRADSEFTDPSVGALLAMRCLALLDSLAPLCWQGHALWPDGISPALAEAWGNEVLTTSLTELVWAEAIGAWAQIWPDLCDGVSLRTDVRKMLAVQGSLGYTGGPRRLSYQFNPLLPCASPLLAGRFVARLWRSTARFGRRRGQRWTDPPDGCGDRNLHHGPSRNSAG